MQLHIYSRHSTSLTPTLSKIADARTRGTWITMRSPANPPLVSTRFPCTTATPSFRPGSRFRSWVESPCPAPLSPSLRLVAYRDTAALSSGRGRKIVESGIGACSSIWAISALSSLVTWQPAFQQGDSGCHVRFQVRSHGWVAAPEQICACMAAREGWCVHWLYVQ